LANLASAVIKDISEAKGDIDIFVESSKPLPVEYRSLLSYGWLAYRHERNVVNFRKEILVSRLLSGHGTTIAELNMLLSKTKMLVREDAELNIDKFEIPTTFANGEKITMQVHRARESKQLPWPALENPRNLLNDVVAPFFTVEALMWDSTQGLSCRFGVPMDMVLRHIENREIHLANSKELISYMDTLKQYRDSRGLCSRLIYRLLKYKRYGFSLCLNKEEIRCKFMPALIKKMMDTYVRPLSTEEKKKISRGMRFAEDWVQVSARTYEKSENAWATQSLHNEYIASVVGESKDLPIEISTIISEYASRSDEDVYYEDPVWRERVAYARARVEDAQKELQMRLAE
jgi:hypothetical protein